MKITRGVLILFSLFLLLGHTSAMASFSSPEDVVKIPFNSEIIDDDEENVLNLSTTLVGTRQYPFISYTIQDTSGLQWTHPATAEAPGNCGVNNSWHCNRALFSPTIVNSSLSNVATSRYGPDTFGVAWAFQQGAFIVGYSREYKNDMRLLTYTLDNLIQISKFGTYVADAPSIERIGGRYRMAVVIWEYQGDIRFYRLVYMQYVGGNDNTSCSSTPSGYQCDVIESGASIASPSLAYAGEDTGIAYVKGNAVRYAYPWDPPIYPPDRPVNCGTEDNPWRCIDIVNPSGGATVGSRVALAYGSDDTHAEIVYSIRPTTKDILMRASYVGSGGDCGGDGNTIGPSPQPVYRWNCRDVDAFIDNLADTTFAVTFDPNDFPVVSWNNKYTGDSAQRLYISYPAARVGEVTGWKKQVVDGNAYSTTGIWNDISINSAGLTSIAYIQPVFRACPTCPVDATDNLKVTRQFFKTYLPLIQK